MSDTHSHDEHHGQGHGDHHAPTGFFQKYVFSTDHKVIGIQFTFASLLFVILGGALALGVRYELAWPGQNVPHKALLPIDMTKEAPEANVAHWQVGEDLVLAKDIQVDGRTLPAGATARLEGFPQGIAVTIPRYTIVEPIGGTPYTLTEDLDAFVPDAAAMGDYNYKRQDARVNVGTVATAPATEGRPARELTLVGREKDIISDAGLPVRVTDRDGPLLLPTRRMATPVQVTVPSQAIEMPRLDRQKLAAMGLDDAAIAALEAGQATAAESNAKLQAQIDELQRQIDAAKAAPAVDEAKIAGLQQQVLSLRRSLADTTLRPQIAGASLTTDAMSVNFQKQALTTDAYLQLFTMHASVMIFFVIIPMLVGGFGNFTIPLMIGARDMAFPKLNALSFWLAWPSGLIMLVSFWTMNGPAGGGWTMYPPLSSLGQWMRPQLGTTMWLFSVALVGFSSIVGALNYITTIINMRAPGMTMFRMPLTVWALFITSCLGLFSTPVLTAALIMQIMDRTLGTVFFVPQDGGQPLMWQHLFWFYSHPAVYIMILPAMGVTSDILSTFARKPIFGYKPMVFAMAAITGLGFIVWGHHMFQSGMNPLLGTTFMASTIMIAVPSAIKTFNWLGTLWGGNIQFTPAMLNALGFVSMFVIGGLSGIFMASAPVDIYIHDTYFIVAHIHYVLFGGSLFGIFAGIYYWFPKMFGRQLDQRWGVIHFVLTIIAFNCTFFMMHILGIGGHPRRYASIFEYPSLHHLQPLNVFMTISAMAMGMAQIPFLYNVFASLPPKLSRAVLSVFLVMLSAPAVIGWTFYSYSFGGAAERGALGFPGGMSLLGFVLLMAGVLFVLGAIFRSYGAWGKAWVVIFGGPVVAWFLAVYVSPLMYLEPLSAGAGGVTAMDLSLHTARTLFWSAQTREILVAFGFGIGYAALLVGVVYGVWWLGAKLRLAGVLAKALYIVTLPAFLAPVLVKPDAYLWLGVAELRQFWWLWLALTALPGLAYLVIARPRDAFGAIAPANPWHANSLEWQTSSPPPHTNFHEIPTVYRGPYEFSSPVVEEDYLPQPAVLPAGVVEPAAH